ncbi:MAG: hypothetical protein D6726_12315, partial [Nitrospirae bacterium]
MGIWLRYYGVALLLLIAAWWFVMPPVVHAQSPDVHFQSLFRYDEENKTLSMPFYLYVDRGKDELYVIDSRQRIVVYNSDLFPIFTIDRRIGIDGALSVDIDSQGNLYILQPPRTKDPNFSIAVLDPAYRFIRRIPVNAPEGAQGFVPGHIAFDSRDTLYLSGSRYPGVLILDRTTGEILKIISPEEEGQKAPIQNVTTDRKGRVFLLSTWFSKIYVYDEDGKFLYKFGQKGGVMGK